MTSVEHQRHSKKKDICLKITTFILENFEQSLSAPFITKLRLRMQKQILNFE